MQNSSKYYNSKNIEGNVSSTQIDLIYKIAIIGDCKVGKTSIMYRSIYGNYSNTYEKTVAVGYNSKVFKINNKNIKLSIWDLSGDKSYRSIIKAYLKHMHGIIFVYDVTNKESFKNINNWLELVNETTIMNPTKLLLANKIDKKNNRVVDVNDGIKYSMKNNMIYLDISAKDYKLMNFLKLFTEFIIDDNEAILKNTKVDNRYKSKSNKKKDIETCYCDII